jgi:integrase
MRRGEILSLKWSDIDLKRNLINIDNTKSGYARSIKINNNTKRILENLEMKNDRVFPISVNSLRLCYQRLCNKLKIKIRFHDFRHEAISRLFEQNLTIPNIASISGHRTMSQLYRYAHFKDSI